MVQYRTIKPTLRRSLVLDRDRILTKIDELDGYVRELRTIAPTSIEEYRRIESLGSRANTVGQAFHDSVLIGFAEAGVDG